MLITWLLLSFAAFPGAEPDGATSANKHSATIIDVAAHDILCSDRGSHGACQWVFALAGSARPPGLPFSTFATKISHLRILGRELARNPLLRDSCPEQTRPFPFCFMETT